MYQDEQAKELVRSIQKQCAHKFKNGWGGTKAISVLFRGIDKDYSQRIDEREFIEGMRHFKIDLTEEELHKVFKHCDQDRNGSIDFREFLKELMPPMKPSRRVVIEEAFDKLDVIKDGVLQMDDLRIVYKDCAMNHPKVKSAEWTLEQAYRSFLDSFDDPNNRDGMVTREEFVSYYAEVSLTVNDDEYFDLMMRNCWGLPQKKSGSQQQHS